MACNLSSGRTEPCKQYVGGIDTIYFMKWSDIRHREMDFDSNNLIDMIYLNSVSGSSITAYKFNLDGVNSFESTSTISHETAGKVFDQSITVTLKGLDEASSTIFNELMSEKTVAFVRDRNVNQFYFFGVLNGMTNNGVLSSGQAMNDLNGITLTLTGQESVPYKMSVGVTAGNLSSLGIVVSNTQLAPTV